MKAALYTRYGGPDVVSLGEHPVPECRTNEIRIRVAVSSVTSADRRFRASDFPGGLWLIGRAMAGLFHPRKPILGNEFSGVVDACGANVTRFKPGDRVVGFTMGGAHAEQIVVSERTPMVTLPETMSFETAAAIPFGGTTALQFLRDFAKLQNGDRVLVLGATGNTGSWFVQVAKALGAEVTAVAGGQKLDAAQRLGADRVIDYHETRPAEIEGPFDVIVDPASILTFRSARPMLAPGGRYVPLEYGIGMALHALFTGWGTRPKMVINVSTTKPEDLAELAEWVANGRIRPLIGKRFSLDDIVDAHRWAESKEKIGSTLVVVNADPQAA